MASNTQTEFEWCSFDFDATLPTRYFFFAKEDFRQICYREDTKMSYIGTYEECSELMILMGDKSLWIYWFDINV